MAGRWKYDQMLKEFLAEFLGTFILMVFGMGSVAQAVLSENKINPTELNKTASNGDVQALLKMQTGSTEQIRWAWGFGVAFGIYVSGRVTGGHLNPAVTVASVLFRRLSWTKLLPYLLGQYIGAFVASCLVFLVYYDAIWNFEGDDLSLQTASIFATYPQQYLSTGNAFGDQVFGTALLMLLVHAVTDENNMAPSKGYLPVIVGLIVVAIGMTFGQNCGYAINPARDLAPRIFTAMAGWGTQVFSVNDYKWFWIPVIGPHVGAILGGLVYEACINQRFALLDNTGHHNIDVDPPEVSMSSTKPDGSRI